ncbi:LbetaH domain-containing protein [Acaryochloris marina]|uniref:putative colanic acid biosynthesis acetyltransferase n=1 Tax=Acaryochloris marina TaxID=155978 RepID=UPI0008FFC386|nr:putative colanic acid biosynthesis acetyltransferase [Acaryochloris marina]
MSSILQVQDPYNQASFSLLNRIYRLIWNIVYILLFRFSPRMSHSWRSFLLRCFGAKIGNNCHVYPSVKIWAPWNLQMSDHACLGEYVNCYSIAKIYLGNKVIISQGTTLCTGTRDYESQNMQLCALPIEISSHTWVCSESFICPGVAIGEGAVIGARSVVTKNMPDWTVCVGNPCKPLKKRKNSAQN